MSKKYITTCIVKRDGNYLEKGSFVENLTSEEIEKGIAQQWLEELGNDESPDSDGLKRKKSTKSSDADGGKDPGVNQ